MGAITVEAEWDRIRWKEQRIALASQIAEDLSLPDSNEDLLSQAQVQVAVDKEMVEADQKQVDREVVLATGSFAGISDFRKFKSKPEGIQGEPEIPILSFKLVQNNSAQAV